MRVIELEDLSQRLHRLQQQLRSTDKPGDQPLNQNDALVQAAQGCEFMLPAELTVRSLAETVDRKINNVTVLLERARRHETLPESAQVAAEQEYLATDEDYSGDRGGQEARDGNASRL